MSDINRFSVMAVLANVYDPLCDVGRTPESELASSYSTENSTFSH